MSAKPTCDCGECFKCRRRVYDRDYYRRNAQRIRDTSNASRARRIEKVRARDVERARERVPDPTKERARANLRKAVQLGRIERQPCEVCGEPETDGHHDDYSKPYDVRWLCRVHHMQLHRKVA